MEARLLTETDTVFFLVSKAYVSYKGERHSTILLSDCNSCVGPLHCVQCKIILLAKQCHRPRKVIVELCQLSLFVLLGTFTKLSCHLMIVYNKEEQE